MKLPKTRVRALVTYLLLWIIQGCVASPNDSNDSVPVQFPKQWIAEVPTSSPCNDIDGDYERRGDIWPVGQGYDLPVIETGAFGFGPPARERVDFARIILDRSTQSLQISSVRAGEPEHVVLAYKPFPNVKCNDGWWDFQYYGKGSADGTPVEDTARIQLRMAPDHALIVHRVNDGRAGLIFKDAWHVERWLRFVRNKP